MGKSWKDKNRRNKWENYGKVGKKPKKSDFNQKVKTSKWDNYEDYQDGY